MYFQFSIPKRHGGERIISAPSSDLRIAQRWILNNILRPIPVSSDTHGFVRGRSIVTNASLHVCKHVVINFDLLGFFPSITYHRVLGMFNAIVHDKRQAHKLASLCTLNGKLPEGAITSPCISNLVCRSLDNRLYKLAIGYGFTYSRYADDITFSGDDTSVIARIMSIVRLVVANEGFRINERKTHVMFSHQRQEVTGLIVNHGLSMPRSWRKLLRACIHNNTANRQRLLGMLALDSMCR